MYHPVSDTHLDVYKRQRVAGMNVTTDGKPGGGNTDTKLRGITTINNSSPLYAVSYTHLLIIRCVGWLPPIISLLTGVGWSLLVLVLVFITSTV